jgi:sulfite reductase (NADPH) hemoprotein beta-component
MSTSLHTSTLGRAHFGFADPDDVDTFVETLGRFERGEIDADAWRAFRLLRGTYGQRQEGDLSMLRAKIPQGILTADQLETLADVAAEFSRGFLHLTTRQNVQLHFLKLGEVGEAMRRLADAGLTTREACGNSVRNITTSPTAGVAADEIFDPTPYAEALTRFLLRHPLSSSLPRKFKIAFSGGGQDHAFASINDIGWIARTREEAGKTVRGFRVTVGGGTALWSQSGKELFAFLPASEIFAVAEAILRVFHAQGDRVHRKKNRMKFLIKQLGWEAWQGALLGELAQVRATGQLPALPFDPNDPPEGEPPPSARTARGNIAELGELVETDRTRGPGLPPTFLPTVGDPRGERFRRTNVRPQRQAGFDTVTVTVPLGDLSSGRLRGLAWIARTFADGTVRTTPGQNIVLRWVRATDVDRVYAALRTLGLSDPDPDSLADVTSCPGAESCKLAVTQSRGLARTLGDAMGADRELVDRADGLVVKVSGCPNGCGLHHVAGLGFQGGLRKVGGRPVPQYHVLVGGDATGDTARFGRLVAKVPARRIVETTRRLVSLYEANRNEKEGESITAYFARATVPELRAAIADLERLEEADATAEDFIDLGEQAAFNPETTEGECSA